MSDIASGLIEDTKYPSFVVRILAFAGDLVVIWVPVFAYSMIFPEHLRSLGPWGRLVGLALALLYFGTLNSRLGGGRSLAKRWAEVRVTDECGRPLSVPRSMLRYLILVGPMQLNGAPIEQLEGNQVLFAVVGVLSFTLLLGIPIFYLLNRPSRRCPHDLLTRSAVVSDSTSVSLSRGIPKVPTLTLGGVMLALLSALLALGHTFDFAPLKDVQEAVRQDPDVWNVMVSRGQGIAVSSNGSRTASQYFDVSVFSFVSEKHAERVANSVAARALAVQQLAPDEVLRVNVTTGYDLGLVSEKTTRRFTFGDGVH